MTQEIIDLAERVGVKEHGPLTRNWNFSLGQLEAFTKLVAYEVREQLIYGSRDSWVLAEREACAKLCDSEPTRDCGEYGQISDAIACADAIRARGK